jgi:hypothetical protein
MPPSPALHPQNQQQQQNQEQQQNQNQEQNQGRLHRRLDTPNGPASEIRQPKPEANFKALFIGLLALAKRGRAGFHLCNLPSNL